MDKLEKLESLYQEFWEDEFKKNGMHNPAKFIDTQPFMYRSKEFGFIKWLVDNNKIDLYKAKGDSDRIYYKEYGSGGFTCSNEEFVLMLLAIQDKPIEFLIYILK